MIFKQAAATIVAIAALSAGSALAEEGPISTASTTSAPPSGDVVAAPAAAQAAPVDATPAGPQSIDAQIADYLATSPAVRPPSADDYGMDGVDGPERKVHGVVSAAVGSHGYRSFYAQSDIPVGKTGTVSIAVGETRGRGLYGYGYSPYGYAPYGYGYGRGPSRSLGLSFNSSDVIRERETRHCRYGDGGENGPRGAADCRTIYRGPSS